MMQSNSDFIPSFARVVAPLRKLLNEESFCWTQMHQKTFHEVLMMFSDNLLLSYFDMTLSTYIFADAHKTGLGAILCLGEDFENLKTVAIASQCTNHAEQNYAKLCTTRFGGYGYRFFTSQVSFILAWITKSNCSNYGTFSSNKHF